jgi:hypothetical protein
VGKNKRKRSKKIDENKQTVCVTPSQVEALIDWLNELKIESEKEHPER